MDHHIFFDSKLTAISELQKKGYKKLPPDESKYAMIDIEYWQKGKIRVGIREQLTPHGWIAFYRFIH